MTALSIEEYIQQGKLNLAVQAAADAVKHQPADEFTRVLYIELLCINSDFEKADQQLSSLMSIKPDLGLALATWRQLVHAAQVRQDVFQLKAKPELIEEATPFITLSLDMILALHENDVDRINTCTEAINSQTNLSQFLVNDDNAKFLRDLDDTTAYLFEVLGTNGKYFWIDFSQVVELEIFKPERLLDVLWRKANIVLTNGTEGEVYLPAIYPTIDDELTAFGRKTEWQTKGSAYRGVGLRTWLLGESDISINDQPSWVFKNNAYASDTSPVDSVLS